MSQTTTSKQLLATMGPALSDEAVTGAEAAPSQDGFLPFAASVSDHAAYLRQFIAQGGEAVRNYKAFSYKRLCLGAGMRVLDVGCGVGADLIPLARRVGKSGLVIGLDSNAARLREARKTLGKRSNMRLVLGNAEQMPFADGAFDRVRADRVLLHIPDLRQALAEMWRVLRPGGILALTEPDWECLALYPGSPAGGDDIHTWNELVQLARSRLAHALLGRQLASLFHRDKATGWAEVQVEAKLYTLQSWQAADIILQISQLAQVLAEVKPARADEIRTWLQALETAAHDGEFVAALSLFFASARKREES